MSIATAIADAQQKVANAYLVVSNKGGTLPASRNLSNLSVAINSIPSGGGTAPVIQQLNITPTTSSQTYTPVSGVDGYGPVNVSAVTSAIDNNILATNIKSGVSILGVTGNVVESVEDTLSITPSTSAQTFTPSSPYTGYNQINVSAVDNNIDANILASNIKNGVTILGITGNYTGLVPSGSLSIGQNGTYDVTNYASAIVNVSSSGGYTELPDYQVTDRSVDMGNQLFAGDLNRRQLVLSGNEFANITNAQSNALQYAFYKCYISGILTFPNLKRTSTSSFQYAFYSTQITNANFTALEIINGAQSFSNCFQADLYLNTINFPSLYKITGTQALYRFGGAASTITLPSLSKLTASKTLNEAFWSNTNISSISFPALNTDSFGSYTDHFYRMLASVTGCTVHFPSNIQSTIGSWSDVTGGFGGTNTTVLFDLPATNHLIGINTIEYERNPKDDTQTALAWRKAEYDSTYGLVVDWTSYYTSGTSNPQVNDTIYSDSNCTIAVTTIDSITQ